ncbi:MAG: DUF4254 domain-containing protein [Planctomycetota bacterium]|nr:DUF4254 domain-containing protein [Planctomycetota bacterium]
MLDVKAITALHRECVVRWHDEPIDLNTSGVMSIIKTQFSFNFRLWHEEDIARSPDAADERIAQVKRNIDQLNQQRNDWIEKIDDWITETLDAQGIVMPADARLNSETPGSVIDRLSILALRIYHLQEQTERDDVAPEHIATVTQKLAICHHQQQDLANSLQELLEDIFAGRKRHQTYRQFKMYNDPNLNPYLYQSQRRRAG